MRLFNEIICQTDSANNLAATALVTHAYLQTGDQKYKQWVLGYADVWLKRIEDNGGIIPDNVGPTGVIGERRGGQFWGGFYGWNSYSGEDPEPLSTALFSSHLFTSRSAFFYLLLSGHADAQYFCTRRFFCRVTFVCMVVTQVII